MTDSDSTYLERVDVREDRPLDVNQFEHRSRYLWAAGLIPGGEVLDVACGTGHGSEVLARNASVTGIDRDPGAVQLARERCEGTFLQAAVPPLPLGDNCVDAVTCFETIEHIQDDAEFISELARVLRPGGHC